MGLVKEMTGIYSLEKAKKLLGPKGKYSHGYIAVEVNGGYAIKPEEQNISFGKGKRLNFLNTVSGNGDLRDKGVPKYEMPSVEKKQEHTLNLQ